MKYSFCSELKYKFNRNVFFHLILRKLLLVMQSVESDGLGGWNNVLKLQRWSNSRTGILVSVKCLNMSSECGLKIQFQKENGRLQKVLVKSENSGRNPSEKKCHKISINIIFGKQNETKSFSLTISIHLSESDCRYTFL